MGPKQVKSTSESILRTSRAKLSPFIHTPLISMIDKSAIGGVILAGGKASRMNFRDKALQHLHGRPLLAYVIAKASPQVAQLVLSLNHNVELYQPFALPIVGDRDRSYGGPLLGILSAMHWFREGMPDSGIHYLACFPADVPQFPGDIVCQLADELDRESADVAYVYHQGQIQPLFSVWKLALLERVEKAVDTGLVGPKQLFASLRAVALDCKDNSPGSFNNINRAEDLVAVAKVIGKEALN